MSGLGTCRDCGQWIYWQAYEADDGKTRHVPFDESSHETMHWETCTAQEYVTDYQGTMARVTSCKKCGGAVYWETTRNGKRRPMNCWFNDFSAEWAADSVCHFETCTGARENTNNWRGEQARRERVRAEAKATGSSSGMTTEVLRKIKLWLPDLGVAWPCTLKDVTSAFRYQALRCHPDMGGEAQEFIKVKRAYDALKDLVPA